MRKAFLCLMTFAVLLLIVPSAMALTVSLYTPANEGITGFKWDVDGYTINLYEEWGALGRGFVLFEGLELYADYTVKKHIWNNTGVNWDRFSNELLDPDDNFGDIGDHPKEAWVPDRYTHSSENDGLSFAQGSGIPRTSLSFGIAFADEFAGRDLVEFGQGFVSGMGGYEEESFGLRDNGAPSNDPWILSQRPNELVIPEPGTLMLLGSGLFALGMARRRK